MNRARVIAALLAALLLGPSGSSWGVCSGGAPPRRPGIPVPTIPGQRYLIGDYARWWGINRDDILIKLKAASGEDLQEYERKTLPPDTLQALLSLVGYEGDFCGIVKEIGLKRLRRFPKVREALIGVLSDPKAVLAERSWAAYALGDLKCRTAIPALIETLKSGDLNLKGFSALSLGKMEDPAAFEAIVPVAKDVTQPEDVRCLVLLGLGRAELPAAREALSCVAQKDVSLSARRAALMALGFKASEGDRALLASCASERDPFIRAAALMGLGFAGDREAVLMFLDKRKEPDLVVRGYAVLALGIVGDAKDAGALIEVLQKDTDFSVRGCAALALGRVQGAGVMEALAEALQNKRYSFVSNYAAIALGLSRKPEALPPLVRGLEARQFDLITSCAAGIAILGLPEGADPLLKSLENRHHAIVREYAAVALGRLRDPKTKKRLFDCMKDPTVEVRHATAIALAVFGDPEACPILEMALQDRQEAVRRTASLAFDLLTDDETKPLTLGTSFKADPRSQSGRLVGTAEINRLLNSYLPENYKLPITP